MLRCTAGDRAAESEPPCSLPQVATTMNDLNAYRCRDGNYLLAPASLRLGCNERDGSLSYLGAVCPEQFGEELGDLILKVIGESHFARMTPDLFYLSAVSRREAGGIGLNGKAFMASSRARPLRFVRTLIAHVGQDLVSPLHAV